MGSTVFSAARVFDGDRVWADHAVVAEGGRVSDLVPSPLAPPTAARRHEPDCTILPGLIDAHAHFMRWQGPLFLASGVTTIRDTGNELRWILDRRAEWKRRPWPRILCTGPLIDGPAPVHEILSRRCAGSAEAVAAVREIVAAGVDGIKLYVGLDPDWLPEMAREAHRAGCGASMHCSSGGVLAAGRAGVDEFHHLDGILADVWPGHPPGWLGTWGLPEFSRRWDRQREVADEVRELGMSATPTLAYWDSQWRVRAEDFGRSEAMRHVPPEMIEWQTPVPPDPGACSRWGKALEAAQRFVGLLSERGVPLLAGSDVPCGPVPPGASLWRELLLLTGAGLSGEQALRSATSGAAVLLGRPELGRLGKGSVADLIFVRGNPLERIPDRPEVVAVVRDGTAFTPEDLLGTARKALESWREDPWARQFEIHDSRRRAAPSTPPKAEEGRP